MTLEESYKLAYKLEEKKLEEWNPFAKKQTNNTQIILDTIIKYCDYLLTRGKQNIVDKGQQLHGKLGAKSAKLFASASNNDTSSKAGDIELAESTQLQENNYSKDYSMIASKMKEAAQKGKKGDFSALSTMIKEYNNLSKKSKQEITSLLNPFGQQSQLYPWETCLNELVKTLGIQQPTKIQLSDIEIQVLNDLEKLCITILGGNKNEK